MPTRREFVLYDGSHDFVLFAASSFCENVPGCPSDVVCGMVRFVKPPKDAMPTRREFVL